MWFRPISYGPPLKSFENIKRKINKFVRNRIKNHFQWTAVSKLRHLNFIKGSYIALYKILDSLRIRCFHRANRCTTDASFPSF